MTIFVREMGAKDAQTLVPGVGHAWNLEEPELFDQVLRAWLSDQPLPAARMALS